jgi:hypothetical protein
MARQIVTAQTIQLHADDWVVVRTSGHTPETYECTSVRSGRETAVGYVLNRLCQKPSDGDTKMLDNLLSLVDTDTASKTYGCMRWYAEETQVSDTNAAFFSVMPLAVLAFARPDLVPAGDMSRMRTIFAQTLPWFIHECRNPRLYYPNKIISDGAVLLAMGTLLGDTAAVDQALAFLRSWSEYTEDRGWGWGENISLGYQRVILISLRFSILLSRSSDEALSDTLARHESEILAEAAFHDGAEFVPSIRSYNFSGAVRKSSFSYSLLGHPESRFETLIGEPGQAWTKTIALLLFPAELSAAEYESPPVPRERVRRIFDRSTATTWVGDGVRLGTISRFPVMPDHYQQDGWGLGWQSFPVSAALGEAGVSALYWYARKSDVETSHPYYGADGLKRNYVLAGRRPYPAVATHAAQSGGVAIVIRTISRMHDEPLDLADQWVFRKGRDSVTQYGEWYVQHSGSAILAVRPLACFCSGSDSLQPAMPEMNNLGNDLAIRVALHSESAGPLLSDRLESAWVIVAADGVPEPSQMHGVLDGLQIEDEARFDFSLPRMNYAYTRVICLSDPSLKAESPVELCVDYHTDLWR